MGAKNLLYTLRMMLRLTQLLRLTNLQTRNAGVPKPWINIIASMGINCWLYFLGAVCFLIIRC
jgi:hypothetical protein